MKPDRRFEIFIQRLLNSLDYNGIEKKVINAFFFCGKKTVAIGFENSDIDLSGYFYTFEYVLCAS